MNKFARSSILFLIFIISFFHDCALEQGPNFSDCYHYRKRIDISGVAAVQNDFVVQLKVYPGIGTDLNNVIYLNNKPLRFPFDIRFTRADGITPIYYYLEKSSEIPVAFWVKIPYDYSGNQTSFYIYYEAIDPFALTNGSNIKSTMRNGWDFDTSFVKDYLLNNATGCGISNDLQGPNGLYDSTENKTFVAIQGIDEDAYITYFDHSLKFFHPLVFVGENPLPIGDVHGMPSLLMDDDGYFHVFFGSHCSHTRYYRSSAAGDILYWDDKSNTLGSNMTYPNPAISTDGTIYVFYRFGSSSLGVRPEVFQKSTDNGDTWSAPQSVIEGNNDYTMCHVYMTGPLDIENNRIPLCWFYCVRNFVGNELPRFNGVYSAYFNCADDHVYSFSGLDLGTSISPGEADTYCRVFNTDETSTKYGRIHIYNGNPYIIYTFASSSASCFYFTRWTGSAWSTPVFISYTDDYISTCDFKINSENNIELYVEKYSDIERWTYNGSAWTYQATIAEGENYDRNLYTPLFIKDASDELKLTFSQDLAGANNGKCFLYGDSGFITGYFPSTSEWVNSTSGNFSVRSDRKVHFKKYDSAAESTSVACGSLSSNVCIYFSVTILPTAQPHFSRYSFGSNNFGPTGICLEFAEDGFLKVAGTEIRNLFSYAYNTPYRIKISNIYFVNHLFDIEIEGVTTSSACTFATPDSSISYVSIEGKTGATQADDIVDFIHIRNPVTQLLLFSPQNEELN